MFQRIFHAILMFGVGYVGIFALTLSGVSFSNVIFTEVGVIAVFMLALAYTFYFRI